MIHHQHDADHYRVEIRCDASGCGSIIYADYAPTVLFPQAAQMTELLALDNGWRKDGEVPVRWNRVTYDEHERPKGRYYLWGSTRGFLCPGCSP